MPDLKTVTFDASQWQLVPKKVTDEMAGAFMNGGEYPGRLKGKAWGNGSEEWYGDRERFDIDYSAMLAAAPTPAAQSAGQGAVVRITGLDEYGPILLWKKHWVNFPAGTELYAAPVNGGERDEDGIDLREAAEMAVEAFGLLGGLIGNIRAKGNYSQETTIRFLEEAQMCLYRLHGLVGDAGERAADAPQVGDGALLAAWNKMIDVSTIGVCEDGKHLLVPEAAVMEMGDVIEAQAALSSPAKPCEHCDDTGDVHDQTGEWRGTCTCPAGVALSSPAKVGGDGLIEQHHRDSAELRRLCEARDQARRTTEHWKAEHLAGNAEIKRLKKLLDAKVCGDEREAFEAWARGTYDCDGDADDGSNVLRRNGPDYVYSGVSDAWAGWQARAAPTSPAKVPDAVMQALDRMSTPLHDSRLSGLTAELDAANIKTIRDYVLSGAVPAKVVGDDQHPDDAAVDRFSVAMKAKLAKKRAQGRGGWDDERVCSPDDLARMLVDHVRKGDPVDVGNLAMMLFNRPDTGAALCRAALSADSDTALLLDRQQDGFERCYEALGITDDRERSWSALVLAISGALSADGGDRKDAERWRAFRNRNELPDYLQAGKFFGAFGDDADTIIDAAIAASTAKGDAND